MECTVQIALPRDLARLGQVVPAFLALIGTDRWLRRVEQLDDEQRSSPYRWKIVLDYHWLEMDLARQVQMLSSTGSLDEKAIDSHALASLRFADMVVRLHSELSEVGKRVLEGRLRDALKAETGFAALYLEVEMARRLMAEGWKVQWPDMEGTGQFDLLAADDRVAIEIECKSLSADAGRQVHRKDFYRFVESVASSLDTRARAQPPQVVTVTLRGRLSPNVGEQEELRRCVIEVLADDAPGANRKTQHLRVDRALLTDVLGHVEPLVNGQVSAACRRAFGPGAHVAGPLSEHGGCLVVIRSEREDDTSKPLLEAMRKAATQFTGTRPALISLQLNDLLPHELQLSHVHRRAAILSQALFNHYAQRHVHATLFSGFDAKVTPDDRFGSSGFALVNPNPHPAMDADDLHRLLTSVAAHEPPEMEGASSFTL